MKLKFLLFALISMQSIFCIDEITRQVKILALRVNLYQLTSYFNRTWYCIEDGIVRDPKSNQVFHQGIQVGIRRDSFPFLLEKELTPNELRDKLSDDSCKSCEKPDEYSTYGCGATAGFCLSSGNPICGLFCLTLGVGNLLKRAKYKKIIFGDSNANVKRIMDETVELYRELHQGGPVQQNSMR